jgi:hypothetical protein
MLVIVHNSNKYLRMESYKKPGEGNNKLIIKVLVMIEFASIL